MHRLLEGFQTQRAIDTAFRHTLRGEAAHMPGMRQGILPEGSFKKAHEIAYCSEGQGRTVATGRQHPELTGARRRSRTAD